MDELRRLVDPARVILDPVELLTYDIDAGIDRGRPDAVVLVESADEAARVVRWAAGRGIPIVARGAGTGLSGGAVAERGGIIIEFGRMDRIRRLDTRGRRAVVEPGVLNQALDAAAAAHGLYYPPDPASGRASTLGGNVAENAGGPHCFKYGVTTNYITGLEVVLADGRLLRLGGEALDYPEYDFCGLITGSEGTLALVTEITVRLIRRPPAVKTLMAAFDSVEQAGEAVSAVVAAGVVPATLEMMDQNIMRIVEDYAHAGLPVDAGAALIVDVDGYPDALDEQLDEVAAILQQHGGRDLRIARTEAERARIWLGRKSAAGAMSRLSPAYYLVDVTVPRSRLAEMLATVNRICAHYDLRVGYVFHAGDGNTHPLILFDPRDEAMVGRILSAGREIVEACVRMDGSITGEHGVGTEKRDYMPLMYTPEELAAMLDVKAVFDPAGVLNPGKVFPEQVPPPRYADPRPVEGPVVHITSAEEAAGIFAALSEARRPARITARENGPTPEGSLLLSTAHLRGIRAFARDDFFVTVAAGTPLAEVERFLEGEGMFLPLAAPDPHASVGSLVATNTNAPLRLRYGGVRDLVLALTAALPDGRLIRAGRPVVKNVAGYDLPKAFVGSWGTLGLIADVTFRVSPLPAARRSLVLIARDLEEALTRAEAAMPVAFVASAVVVAPVHLLPGDSGEGWAVVYTAEGHPREVDAELAEVREVWQGAAREDETLTGTALWSRFTNVPEDDLLLRVGLPPSRLDEGVRRLRGLVPDADLFLDVGSGFIFVRPAVQDAGAAAREVSEVRRAARDLEGYAILLHASPDVLRVADRFGFRPEIADLMRGLKARWDPAGVLPTLVPQQETRRSLTPEGPLADL